ncbi:D-alanine--poly(phosphoribitol) ligase [Streptomyces sp. So13.3]|uniref:amino acid adenylation domain-containing protein n=1 Tax=unclassified Streptomyces TaxID=2593676 RepID=UPI001106B013|nr:MULTISPECIES: amino acid adenylation domain-containing protein [unclassified Streptomyces]NEA74280.1 D-alanine--poly(phosphoribitol) ligase [Streptomyces sp. SID13588]QNA71960.1 D-alanine--poly(phosphoribitol) ligase [Streptomyces sp. So13.3]
MSETALPVPIPEHEPAPDLRVIRLPRPFSTEQAARTAFLGPAPLTYGELAAHVDAAASRLAGLGATAGDRIAIWMDKTPCGATAILAALQARCAYVPLDGAQPPSRVETILADAEPIALFTDVRHLPSLSGITLPTSLRVIVVSGDVPAAYAERVPVRTWESFSAASATVRAAGGPETGSGPGPDDLAAILYTSGSTGVPKGVQISHRNLACFIGWARQELDVGPDDVFANHASFNFDLSTFDLFTALSVGAAVWIVADSQARDVAALAAGIRENGVTVWYSVPSILHLLTASGALTDGTARSLRYVLFAGEVYPMPQLRALLDVLPEQTVLYNLYGPTETNVCTYYRLRAVDATRTDPVPIGSAVAGARLSVVDPDGLALHGADAFGELVVEGDCVTAGYWRREEESLAAGHPKGSHATGDLVSYEDGLLVYRGRKDRMVKLSGYRVELGEIESAVLRHPAVATAAIVLDGEGPTARVALYYTLHPGAERPGLLEIKRHCAQYVPAYMLPRVATCLDELPYNANGKIAYPRLAAGAAHADRRPS